MDKKLYTWAEVEDMCSAIVAGARGREFTTIWAVSRGGLIPAYFIAEKLGIRNVQTICLSSYDGAEKRELKPEAQMFPVFHPGEKVLVVDDICDTGETLAFIKKEYLKCFLSTATLVNKNVTTPPDFYAEVLPLMTWAVFPWEASN